MSPLSTLPQASKITIDWSEVMKNEQEGVSIDQMMEFVRGYPEARNIHVYLSTARTHLMKRRLQNTLLSMGCTVTVR